MLMTIDTSSERPVYEQIADSVRRAAATGALSAGDKLPPANEVATGLDVNKHTVLRAYQQLRDEGLVDLRRGRGAVITAAATALVEIAHDMRTLVERAARIGIAPATLAALIAHPNPGPNTSPHAPTQARPPANPHPNAHTANAAQDSAATRLPRKDSQQ